MNRRGGAGFTIIESVLFLAVSTALAVAILASSSAVIAQQRYKDSTTRLQSFIQSQYINANYIINSREEDWACSGSGIRQVPVGDSTSTNRGTTDCYVLGKVLILKDEGAQIESRTVIAAGTPTADEEEAVANDFDAFAIYDVSWTEAEQEVYDLDWGASLARSTPGGVGPAIDEQYIFVLKSPYSGSMRTFWYDPSTGSVRDGEGAPFTIGSLDSSDRELPTELFAGVNPELTYCIQSPELTVFQSTGLIIKSGAASPSGIELQGDGSVC